MIRSYPPLVGGVPDATDHWVYTARASALIRDPLTVGRMVLQRERGQADGEDCGDPRLAGRVALARPDQLARALRAARTAQPAWARVPLDQRLSLVSAFHRRLARRGEEFVDLCVAEGHPLPVARWELSGMLEGSHQDSIAFARSTAEHETRVGHRTVRLHYQPDGVVALSPPQNAPASAGSLGVWALAGGNALVVGAPRSSPLALAFLYQEIVSPALAEVGAPPGVLSVLCGDTKETLRSWLESPDVDTIFYFGSSRRGLALAAECLARGKKPVLELSGNDGALIWRDADPAQAARALAECFHASGQICMVPRYAIVHPDIADRVIAAVVEQAEALRPGLPEDPQVLLSPVFKAPKFRQALREATAVGARVVTGGAQWDHTGRPATDGIFIQPTVIRIDGLQTASAIPGVYEETFFPLLKLVVPDPAPDAELLRGALAFLDANPYGLRNSLWAADPDVIARFSNELRNGGILKINDTHSGNIPVLPTHGGTGHSGGPFGGAALPLQRTSRLQAVCDATYATEQDHAL